jgi:hypothetical protein
MDAKWLWLALVLTACGNPDEPNGKEGVLFFRTESDDPVAEGLEADLTLPDEVTPGGEEGDSASAPRFKRNFANTTLEVGDRPGISVVETRQVPLANGGLSYRLTYRCESAGSHELRIRVLAQDKTPRYADAFDVACARPVRLSHDYVGAVDAGILPGGYFLVGAKIQVSLKVTDRNGGTLAGRGAVELVDEQGVTRPMPNGIPSSGRSLYLEALKPGGGLKVRFAGLEAPLPVQVVEDAAISLELGVHHIASNGWSAVAEARHIPTANRVGGLAPCTWAVRFSSGTVTGEEGKCYRTIPDNLGSGTVCVFSHGKTACADFPDSRR